MAANLSAPSAAHTLDAKIPFPSSSLRLHLKDNYDFSDTEQIAEKDRAFIVVLGASGSGKSSFINAISGSQIEVNHDLEPYEHPVKLGEEFEVDGRLITLIDTPGLDVSTGVNIMRGIFSALEAPMGIKLHGVIFLHSISAELPGFSERLFSLSKNLCMEKDLRKLVVVKTSWAEAGVTPEQIAKLELQVDSFFKPARVQGANVVRCDFDSGETLLESTRQWIRSLLEPVGQRDNQLANEEDVSSTESTIPPAQMKFSKVASSGKKGRGSRYVIKHKSAPRRYFLYAHGQRVRPYAGETTRRRRNKDATGIRDGFERLLGERRSILARVGRLRARLRRMTA